MIDLGFKQLKILPKIINRLSYWCDCPVCWHSTETWILSRLSVLEAPPSYAPTQPSTTSQTQIKVNSPFIQSQSFQIFLKSCSTYMNHYTMCSVSCYVNFNIYLFYSYPTFISTFWQLTKNVFIPYKYYVLIIYILYIQYYIILIKEINSQSSILL